MEITIQNIKRIRNGWLVHGYTGTDASVYIELFVDSDGLVELITNARNKHKKDDWKKLGGDEGEAEEEKERR